ATKGVSDSGDSVDKSLGAFRVHFNVKNIDASKPFKQDTLALNNRLTCQRPQIAQPKNGGTIRDHRDQIAFIGVLVSIFRVFRNFPHWLSHTRTISKRQVT